MQQAPFRHVILHHPGGNQAGPQPRQHGIAQRVQAVGAQPWPDGKAVDITVTQRRQCHFVTIEGLQCQPRQCLQRCRRGGQRPPGEQRRCGHGNARHFGQPDGHHRRIIYRPDLDGAVDAFGDEIRPPVMQQPFHCHPRMAIQIGHQRRNQLALAKRMRRDDAQMTFRLVLDPAQVRTHRLPAVEQRLGMGEAAPAVVGQGHGMGRALQQLQSECAFQCLQPPADRWLAGLQLRRGGRQAARFDDADEGLHQSDPVQAGKIGVFHTSSV